LSGGGTRSGNIHAGSLWVRVERMYIVAIAWLYVTLMMAITENSVVGGVLTFVFYGLAPLGLFLWVFGTPARRRRKLASMRQDQMNSPDTADTQSNERDLLDGGGQRGALVEARNEIGNGDIHHAGDGKTENRGDPARE
jgi:hypothetical protein